MTLNNNATEQGNQFYYQQLNQVSNIIGYYAITVVASLGFVLNAVGVKLLSSQNLLKKHNFYKYILTKTICDMVVCLIGISYLNNTCLECVEVQQNLYGIVIFRFYSIAFIRVTLFSSAWSEVYLNYNRYSTLVGKKTWLTEISLKYYVPVLFGFPILFSVPFYLSRTIQLRSSNVYFMALNNFGQSTLFIYYYLLLFVIESILPMILLTILSFLNIIEFKKLMQRKLTVTAKKHSQKIKLTELKFAKVILILTALFMLVRVLDLTSGILYRLISLNAIEYTPVGYSIINFARQAAYLLEYFNYMICIFVLASVDQNVSILMKITLNRIL